MGIRDGKNLWVIYSFVYFEWAENTLETCKEAGIVWQMSAVKD